MTGGSLATFLCMERKVTARPPRRQALGKLHERDHAAERQPLKQLRIQLAGGGCSHFH